MSDSLLSCPNALSKIMEVASRRRSQILRRTEEVLIEASVGRVCVQNVFVRDANPGFNNSAMDGFVTRCEWTLNASEKHPFEIPVRGCIAAGDDVTVAPDMSPCFYQIMTGARVPDGLDCVLRQEDAVLVEKGGETHLSLSQPLKIWDQIRLQGEDFKQGEPLLQAGNQISVGHVMALASQGFTHVEVAAPIRVGLICTGAELLAHGDALHDSKIRNTNAPFLQAYLRSANVHFEYLGIVDDLKDNLHSLIVEQMGCFDVLLSTGAVSVGKFDIVPPVVESLGATIHFHKLALRPGKPLLFAELNHGPLFMGFPGNPISGVVAARFFLDPLLRCLFGLEAEIPERLTLKNDVRTPEHLSCFWRARQEADGILSLPGQESFRIGTLCEASHWILFPEGRSHFRAGDEVQAWPMEMSL